MPESDRDKTIEVMIAALDEQFGDTISPLGIRAIASIALTALQASGMAVVPVEPTPECTTHRMFLWKCVVCGFERPASEKEKDDA